MDHARSQRQSGAHGAAAGAQLVGSTITRMLVDKGYRGHNAPPERKFRVFISGQKRGVTPSIKRQLRRGPPSGP